MHLGKGSTHFLSSKGNQLTCSCRLGKAHEGAQGRSQMRVPRQELGCMHQQAQPMAGLMDSQGHRPQNVCIQRVLALQGAAPGRCAALPALCLLHSCHVASLHPGSWQ